MQLYLAADHAGFALKEKLKTRLAKQGYEIFDVTPTFHAGDDYPLVAKELSSYVQRTAYDVQRDQKRGTRHVVRGTKGLLICGSGIGVCIASNRHKGIRAAVGHDAKEVKLAREHNDINILCLSGRLTKINDAIKMIEIFLKTKKSKEARHARRVKQLS
ncbi:MAG: RpiB/LacA/LacB family sugar-phosphate isomerase [Patescibacteria group bacterium]|jgi:ribose 5-phosphate isomerase B